MSRQTNDWYRECCTTAESRYGAGEYVPSTVIIGGGKRGKLAGMTAVESVFFCGMGGWGGTVDSRTVVRTWVFRTRAQGEVVPQVQGSTQRGTGTGQGVRVER